MRILLAVLLFLPACGQAVVTTSLAPAECRSEIDKTDPNETTYLVCPGARGYSLIIRKTDTGGKAIEIGDPAGKFHSRPFDSTVTGHPHSLGRTAEWRNDAVTIPVELHEDPQNPETITRTLPVKLPLP